MASRRILDRDGRSMKTDDRENPESGQPPEITQLACLAAALVLRRSDTVRSLIESLRSRGLARVALTEVILQTYLFDGYPTALEGFELLEQAWPSVEIGHAGSEAGAAPPDSWEEWERRGRTLYERIYGDVAARLEQRTRHLSPYRAFASEISATR